MISDRLKRIVLRELELDDWELTDATVASEVPGWDSLSHARIIAAVEDDYGVRFKIGDLLRLANVGQLQALVDAQGGKR